MSNKLTQKQIFRIQQELQRHETWMMELPWFKLLQLAMRKDWTGFRAKGILRRRLKDLKEEP